MKEDRIKILESARALALTGASRFQHNKALLGAYAELGIEYYRLTGSYEYFDEAIRSLHEAEERLADPDISKMIPRLMRRVQGQPFENADIDG